MHMGSPDVIVPPSGIQLDANACCAPDLDQRLSGLEGKTNTILNGATPLVGTVISASIEELMG